MVFYVGTHEHQRIHKKMEYEGEDSSAKEGPVRNIARKDSSPVVRRTVAVARRQVPDDILNNVALNDAIQLLPTNYNFEIHKTIWRIRTERASVVALQFPEGLLMYACVIADIITTFGGAKVLILGDVTYGACCVDDFTACKLGANLLVHYGHSCLVPINITRVKVVYVFVEIFFDSKHLVDCISSSFSSETHIALLGTIQFTSVLHAASLQLSRIFPNCVIPQSKPLSSGMLKNALPTFFQVLFTTISELS